MIHSLSRRKPKMNQGKKEFQKTEEMPLDGGVPVPIKIKMYHSIHNSLFEDGNAFF